MSTVTTQKYYQPVDLPVNTVHRRSWPILHPYLLSMSPALALYAHIPGKVMWWELALASGSVLVATAVVSYILRALYPNPQRAALATSWVVLLVFAYGFVYEINSGLVHWGLPFRLHQGIVLPVWAILLIAGMSWFGRPREDDISFTRLANLFASVVVGASLLLIARTAMTSPHVFQQEFVPAATPPEPIVLSMSPARPDIYYLVFDRYPSARTLREDFDCDNTGFLQKLAERGFFVANDSHANYPKTDLSMASALNMQYHGDAIGPKSQYLQMLQHHRVGRLLQQQGYRYYHLGNLLDGIRSNGQADVNYQCSRMPTEYTDILFQFTALYPMLPTTSDRQRVLEKFTIVEQLASMEESTFVYAHFIVPQGPWKFDRDGSVVTAAEAAARTDRQNFVNQLIYTNHRIEQLVDSILSKSKCPPIIVIQAGEGPELVYKNDAELSELEIVRRRCGILSAFYLPGKHAQRIVPATISPVNTFRLIFKEYFGAKIELLDDRFFYWEHANEIGKPDYRQVCHLVEYTEPLMKLRRDRDINGRD